MALAETIRRLSRSSAVAGVIALVVSGGITTPARAVTDFEDISVIVEVLNRVLEFERTGTVVPWENPKTGNSGTIMPIETILGDDGTPCRVYERTYVSGDQSKVVKGKACRSNAGVWKVVEESDVEVAAPEWVEPLPDEPVIADPEIEPDLPDPVTDPVVTASVSPAAETQKMLADAGYYNGPIDGEMTPAFRAAILDYEMAHDPAIDGGDLENRLRAE